MRVFRIGPGEFAAAAWTGEGPYRFGARWNSVGVRVVYTSNTLTLAALEFFVHMDPGSPGRALVASTVEIEEKAIETIPGLTADWPHHLVETRRLGDDWVNSRRSLGLRVPSTIVAGEWTGEWNVLLNPAHPGFGRLKPEPGRAFRFDHRMFRR